MSKRDTYSARLKIQLEELNTRIDDIDIRAEQAKQDARRQYKSEMAKLRQFRFALVRLNELRPADESWIAVAIGLAKIRGTCIDALYYFKSQFLSSRLRSKVLLP